MPKHVITHTPEQIARAREVHMRGGTQDAVAAVLGCSQQTAGRRMKEWCWPRVRPKARAVSKIRFLAVDEAFCAPLPAAGAFGNHAELGAQERRDLEDGLPDKHLRRPAPAAPERRDLTARLRSLVAREMTRAEAYGGPPADVARTLGSLARTLKTLAALPDMHTPEDEFDVEAFERDLAVHLQKLAAEIDAEKAETMAGGDGI